MATILVLGGTGTFGRLIVADLLVRTPHKIISASRRGIQKSEWLPGSEGRVSSVKVDGSNEKDLSRLIEKEGASVLIHAAGPYSLMQSAPLQACINTKTNYADMCPRSDLYIDYQKKFAEKTADIFCVVGASTAGGVTGILTRRARKYLNHIDKASSYLCVHNFAWGGAAVADYLIGSGFPILAGTRGGSAESVLFPPLGMRKVRLADSVEALDLEKIKEVEYRFGLDGFLPGLGMRLAVLASKVGLPLWRMGGLLGFLAGKLGGSRTEGGLLHRAFGVGEQGQGVFETHVHRPFGNVRVPGLLCALMAARMASKDLPHKGWMHPAKSITPEDLLEEFSRREVLVKSRFVPQGAPLNAPWLEA
jgi:hypothetical protein